MCEERPQGGVAGGQEPRQNAKLTFLVNLGSENGGRGGTVCEKYRGGKTGKTHTDEMG